MEMVKVFYVFAHESLEREINAWLASKGNSIQLTRVLQTESYFGASHHSFTVTIFYIQLRNATV